MYDFDQGPYSLNHYSIIFKEKKESKDLYTWFSVCNSQVHIQKTLHKEKTSLETCILKEIVKGMENSCNEMNVTKKVNVRFHFQPQRISPVSPRLDLLEQPQPLSITQQSIRLCSERRKQE